MTSRRNLLAFGLAAAIAPRLAFAQQPARVWRVGVLNSRGRSDAPATDYRAVFVPAMRELGYVEGSNLAIEWRFAEGSPEGLPAMAQELVRLKVDLIVTGASAATQSVQKASAAIPIVMVNVGDPVALGFVKSLARPEGNITGLSNISPDLIPKHLEMLLRVLPRLSRVAVLADPANPAFQIFLSNVRSAAQRTKVTILPIEARSATEIDSALSRSVREKAGALIVAADPGLNAQYRHIAALAAKNRLPSVGFSRAFAEAGGLMSYGVDLAEGYRRAAVYAVKIFKGAKPGELPVELPTRFDLVINRKTARALGLTVPQELLLQADKVIE